MKKIFSCMLLLSVFLSCFMAFASAAKDPSTEAFRSVTEEEALALVQAASPGSVVILDVRTQEEFDDGHLPDALCLPNEEITDTPPEILPDFDQPILVYCRSGSRSEQAARKLAAMGYTDVTDLGGVLSWDGTMVVEDERGSFHAATKEPRLS